MTNGRQAFFVILTSFDILVSTFVIFSKGFDFLFVDRD